MPPQPDTALNSPDFQQVEESLRQHIRRLQALRDIEHAVLTNQGEQAAAVAALQHIPHLAPAYHSSSVLLVDLQNGEARLLAIDRAGQDAGGLLEPHLSLGELAVDLELLRQGLTFQVDDLAALDEPNLLQRKMLAVGIYSYLTAPMCSEGQLVGVLNLAASQTGVFHPEQVQIAREVADSLAVAIQQARLRRAEGQRRQEAEVMRDVMAAMASAGNLKQTLEAILVNLHNVIHYDRAGLFLADENQRYVMAPEGAAGLERSAGAQSDQGALVAEMRQARRPVVVADASDDPRFADWPDMQPVRSWLGAPLLAGEEMIGFLGLGSLEAGAYSQADADLMEGFAWQVAAVLEKAWEHEKSHRYSEELEVLSNFTIALGRAESAENTLAAISEQVQSFFNASRSAFLFPDPTETSLVVQVCPDESLVGLAHPYGDDLLWQALSSGQARPIPDARAFLSRTSLPVYAALFGGARSALVIPLQSGEGWFGVLCCAFENRRDLKTENLHLYQTVAEIAGASLRRAVVLEGLERQVSLRTQHLNTLYDINAISSEALDLQAVLEQVLDITLASLNGRVGAIHLLDEQGRELYLAAQRNVPPGALAGFETLSTFQKFWRDLLASTRPRLLPDLRAEAEMPERALRAGLPDNPAYIGAPLRAKGQALGLLSLFGASIQGYSLEDITLFMTIADQVGGLVERARLARRAEQAAVVQERQRLARELHDSVTQLLYGQVLFSGAGSKVLRQGNQPLAEQHLVRIEQAAQQALKEMRLMIFQLRPSDPLDEEGLVGALERRLDAVERRTGVDARLTIDGDLGLNPATEAELYRIAEEALNNTLKHAQASAVRVKIEALDDRVQLEISDNGRGFDLQSLRPGGMGLSTMRQRVDALGGRLQVISTPGQGTSVRIEVDA